MYEKKAHYGVLMVIFMGQKNEINTASNTAIKTNKIMVVLGVIASIVAILSFLFPKYQGLHGKKLPISIFTEQLSLNWPSEPDDLVLNFFTQNIGKTVYLDVNIDMSSINTFTENVSVSCGLYSDTEEIGDIFNRYVFIPFYLSQKSNNEKEYDREFDCSRFAIKIVTSRNRANITYGGPGVIQAQLTGFFNVERMYSGAMRAYILTEQQASVEMHVKYQQ